MNRASNSLQLYKLPDSFMIVLFRDELICEYGGQNGVLFFQELRSNVTHVRGKPSIPDLFMVRNCRLCELF